MRDPRHDPLPGDELMIGPQWQSERYMVLSVRDGDVHYQLGPMRAVLSTTLANWREWAKGADILAQAAARGTK